MRHAQVGLGSLPRMATSTTVPSTVSDTLRRRAGRWLAPVGALSVLLLAAGSPASAEVLEGSCEGSVVLEDELVVATSGPDTVATMPPSGTLGWSGSDPQLDGEGVTDVEGQLLARHPFGWLQLASWSGDTVGTEASGTATYAVPGFLPRGSGPIPLELDVALGAEPCRIAGTVQLEGAVLDPLSAAALLVGLVLLVAMMAGGRADARGRGRPVLALVAGGGAGIAGAATLFGVAVIPLDSPVWWILPLLLAALGLALGAAAPFGREAALTEPVDAATGTRSVDGG